MAQQIDISKMETTQTAVNWFVEQLPQIDWDDPFYVGILQEANKMFEEQIIKAVDSNFSYDNNGYPTLGEQYYNENYNK